MTWPSSQSSILEYIAPRARTRSMMRMATEKLGVHGRRCALERVQTCTSVSPEVTHLRSRSWRIPVCRGSCLDLTSESGRRKRSVWKLDVISKVSQNLWRKNLRNARSAQMRKVSYISKLSRPMTEFWNMPRWHPRNVQISGTFALRGILVPSQSPLEWLGWITQLGCYHLTGPMRRNLPIEENVGEYACSRKRA